MSQKRTIFTRSNSYFMGGTGPLIRHLRTHEDLREELKTAIFRPQAR